MPPAIVTVTPNGSVDLVAETAGATGHIVARFWASAGCEHDVPWPPDLSRRGTLHEVDGLR